MPEKYQIALVVGRTFIRSALIDESGNILPDSFSIFSAKANETKEHIVQNLVKIIKFNINSILHPNFQIEKIGLSFSEPFDYEKGVSYFQGIDKFEALYQVNLKETLQDWLNKVPSIKSKLSKGYTIQFENEVKLFGVGEQGLRTEDERKKRVLYLMIGSSFGAVFFDNGEIDAKQTDQLVDGSYKAGTRNDYLSRQGLIQIALKAGAQGDGLKPGELAEQAAAGNQSAQGVFQIFGQHVAETLNPYLETLTPDEIIIGGSLAKTYPLFCQSFQKHLIDTNVQIHPTEFTPYYIFLGIAEHLK